MSASPWGLCCRTPHQAAWREDRIDRGRRVAAPEERRTQLRRSAAAAVLRTASAHCLVRSRSRPRERAAALVRLGSSAASAAAGAYAAALAIDGRGARRQARPPCPVLLGEHVADDAWHGRQRLGEPDGRRNPSSGRREDRPYRIPAEPEVGDRPPRLRVVDAALVGGPACARESEDAVHQTARFASLVEAWRKGDPQGIGEGLVDRFCRTAPRPARAGIRGGPARRPSRGSLRDNARGAGPSVLIVSAEGRERAAGEVARKAFRAAGLSSTMLVCAVDVEGAREV